MNAGSTTANAADVTQTNGSWDITADTFIAAAATPFSGVTANVDYASIYVDGATTGAVYVALITAVNAGGLSVTLSTTIKYGTKPSASATARSCKVNGAWADETALVALGSGAVPQSTKVNWKQATYTITATRTIALAGTTTAPLWISGYNTTPGDLDADITNSLSKPILALNSTFTFTWSGVYQYWSNLSITGSRSGTILTVSGTGTQLERIRADNTSANAAAIAFTATTALLQVAYCWFRTPTTATTTGTVLCSIGIIARGTVFEGGGLAGINCGAQDVTLINCIGINNTGSGVLLSTGRLRCSGLTIYNASVDGVKWSGTPTSGSYIDSSVFELCGGWGINNASGANTGNVLRTCNDFHSCTLGQETGFGDVPAFFGQTDSSTIVTSSTDMTPVSGTNARSKGFPGIFENGGVLVSQASYADIGAVRHIDPSGGSGTTLIGIIGDGASW